MAPHSLFVSLFMSLFVSLLSLHVATATVVPPLPTFRFVSGGVAPIISDKVRAAHAGYGFEGGRTVKVNGTTYLFTAEFRGWPVNANMRLGLWKSNSVFDAASWTRVGTVADASSAGDPTSVATWNKTCDKDNLKASPWAPFPVFDSTEDRWHVHWVSYACDMSWAVRVGIGNLMGAASTVHGRDGIEGPYETYAENSVIIGPNATAPNATRWGSLSDCARCHTDAPAPVYCAVPPCQFDNGKTGAAICAGPFSLSPATDPPPSAAARFVAFVGLDHDLAWAPSMRGPWTIGTAASTGQQLTATLSTSTAMYTENPVVTEIEVPAAQGGGVAYVAVFDTVSPSGGWVEADGRWVSGGAAGRGESYGFGVSFSLDGRFWSRGVDVALPGGCRTPLGMTQDDDGGTGGFTMLFTRRFADCTQQVLPPGSRGDGANGRSMCANLYAARFEASWGDWSS